MWQLFAFLSVVCGFIGIIQWASESGREQQRPSDPIPNMVAEGLDFKIHEPFTPQPSTGKRTTPLGVEIGNEKDIFD